MNTLATLLLSSTLAAAAQHPIPYGNNPAVGKFYDINGFRMYTETYGSGPALLMIHGNNGSIAAFSKNIPYFTQHYTVILADSRSQGKSLDPDHHLTFEMMADDFAALLDAMHIPSAFVIGWSDGGIDALLLALRHPEKVIRLASTGANLTPTADAFAPGVWDEMKKEYDAGVTRTTTVVGDKINTLENENPYTTAKEKNDRKLFLLDYYEPNITLDQLHTIQTPSLIICGDHDLISVSHTVQIFQNLPHAELWVVPNSGHATLIEHTDDFNRTVDTFFTQPFQDHH